MTHELNQLIREASVRESNDDHLNDTERANLVARIRLEDNIDPSVSSEDIYMDYIVE